MHGLDSFKEALLRHMLAGLRGVENGGAIVSLHDPDFGQSMSILLQRKDAIKICADAAMALARGGNATGWSRSLVAALCKQPQQQQVLKSLMGKKQLLETTTTTKTTTTKQTQLDCHRPTTAKSLPKRRRRIPGIRRTTASVPRARRMAEKRVHLLKRLVPGGPTMDDEASFLGETIDYILALRALVDVMKRLAGAAGSL